MEYTEPQVIGNADTTSVDTQELWFSVETFVAGIAVVLMNVAITAIDITP